MLTAVKTFFIYPVLAESYSVHYSDTNSIARENECLLTHTHRVLGRLMHTARSIYLTQLSDEERKALDNLAKAFSYFARERAYGYIDRLANTYSIASLRLVLEEALRALKSERDRGETIFMPTGRDVETFMTLVERDLDLTKIVASLALAYSFRKLEGKEEVKKEEGKEERK